MKLLKKYKYGAVNILNFLYLLKALRKAPQHSAVGFKQTVQKLLVTVELLLGDIPERSIFHQAHLKRSLAPYFQLTQGLI